jgi:quercetin dioxygenase-like cupin family protein
MKEVALVLSCICIAAAAAGGSSAPLKILRNGEQPSVPGPQENFTGSVRVDSRFQAQAPARAGGGLVTFEPGARTAWHTHPLGRSLIVIQGVGLVQRCGVPVEQMRAGDVVWIPPAVKHWHGATPTQGMSHYAIAESLDGKTVEWMEKVSDAQYAAPR